MKKPNMISLTYLTKVRTYEPEPTGEHTSWRTNKQIHNPYSCRTRLCCRALHVSAAVHCISMYFGQLGDPRIAPVCNIPTKAPPFFHIEIIS